MAVINENVSAVAAREYWIDLAYIRGASGREFSTSAENIQPAQGSDLCRPPRRIGDPRPGPPEQPRTAAGRHADRSA